jgi:hypothetical protein
VDHNVCSGKFVAAEEFSLTGRFHQVILEEVKVSLQFWVDKARLDLGGYTVGNGLDEEGYGCVLNVYVGD